MKKLVDPPSSSKLLPVCGNHIYSICQCNVAAIQYSTVQYSTVITHYHTTVVLTVIGVLVN